MRIRRSRGSLVFENRAFGELLRPSERSLVSAGVGQFPRLPIIAADQPIGVAVVGNAFALRVPADLSPDAQRNVSQMSDRGRVMGHFQILDRLLPAFQAFEEI